MNLSLVLKNVRQQHTHIYRTPSTNTTSIIFYSSITRYCYHCYYCYTHTQPSLKTFRTKRTLAKKQKQNRQIPNWIRYRTDNKIRYNSKRRHWRRTKLGI